MKTVYTVRGMHCASCVGRLQKALEQIEGVSGAQVNLATEEALVETGTGFDEASVRSVAGFELRAAGTPQRVERIGADALLAVALAIALKFLAGTAAAVAATVAVGWCGRRFAWGALRLLRHGAADMNTLVAVGTWTALLWSLFGGGLRARDRKAQRRRNPGDEGAETAGDRHS